MPYMDDEVGFVQIIPVDCGSDVFFPVQHWIHFSWGSFVLLISVSWTAKPSYTVTPSFIHHIRMFQLFMVQFAWLLWLAYSFNASGPYTVQRTGRCSCWRRDGETVSSTSSSPKPW